MTHQQGKAMNGMKYKGVAILEALVAILIFSMGILGLIGLQAAMTRAQTSGKIRADAINLVEDLFALVQTDNQGNLAQYRTASCAAHPQCADWAAKVNAQLPGAQAPLVVTNGATGLLTVTLRWVESSGEAHQYIASMTWNP